MKKSVIKILVVILFLSLMGCGTTALVKPETGNKESAETAGVDAARVWLSLVDNQKYSESWEEASQLFKTRVTKEQWIEASRIVREPLGKNLSRELGSKVYSTSMTGAPRGEYVKIVFNSSFENRKSAIETIPVVLEKDGKWRAVGYLINLNK